MYILIPWTYASESADCHVLFLTDYAYNDVLLNTGRSGVTKVVIAVTDDSGAATPSLTQTLVTSAQSAGDIFIVIGLGVDVPQASTDENNNFFRASTASDLSTYVDQVVAITCPRTLW